MTKSFVKTGLIGHPVSHSKSPLIHSHWIKKYALHGSYTAIDLPCETLHEGVKKLIDDGFAGFNVTVPHKVEMLSFCDDCDVLAQTVGAVNTVTIKNGKLSGTNTDVFGFIENLRSKAPDFYFTKGAALVLGAGGASRAVVQGLLDSGTPEILIANRTRSNADTLLKDISTPQKIKIIPWDDRNASSVLEKINLLVNTTSLGMTGKAPLEINLDALSVSALVCDIVYAPLMTDLLVTAKTRGNPVVTGIGMLLHQARPGFKLWHGLLPEVTPELDRLALS